MTPSGSAPTWTSPALQVLLDLYQVDNWIVDLRGQPGGCGPAWNQCGEFEVSTGPLPHVRSD